METVRGLQGRTASLDGPVTGAARLSAVLRPFKAAARPPTPHPTPPNPTPASPPPRAADMSLTHHHGGPPASGTPTLTSPAVQNAAAVRPGGGGGRWGRWGREGIGVGLQLRLADLLQLCPSEGKSRPEEAPLVPECCPDSNSSSCSHTPFADM